MDRGMLKKGGIDLTTDRMNLDIRASKEGIKFTFDPALMEQLKNASGFTPVVVTCEPQKDIRGFLGIPEDRAVEYPVVNA